MNLPIKSISAAFLISLPLSTMASPEIQSFVSNRSTIQFRIDWDLEAVRISDENRNLTATTAKTHLVSSVEEAQFEKLGFELRLLNSPTGQHLSHKNVNGVPIWFSGAEQSKPAVGILTNWIVFKTSDKNIPAAVSDKALFIESIPFSNGVFRSAFDSPKSALTIANSLHQLSNIVYAHPDFILEIEARDEVPQSAPYFDLQWNLENRAQLGGKVGADINIAPAWERTRGQEQIIVAVLDLGFEQNHPAMTNAWYKNSGEIPGNKIDDDKNGYKDDSSGWNFATSGNNLLYGASNKHGTATSGIVGARMGGKGTVGICPKCTILPLVVDNIPSNAAAAFFYANAAGAAVVSNSWGYSLDTPKTDVVVDAINTVATQGRNGKGTSIVFAMSNFPRNDCRSTNPDISSIPSVIAVSSSDQNDVKTTTSAFGPCLKILAPSSDSTSNAIIAPDRVGANGYNDGSSPTNIPDADYTNGFYGTSAAAPQVAGVIGLLYSINPNATAREVLDSIIGGADKINPTAAAYDVSGHSEKYGYGRLNAGRAADELTKAEQR